jgi:hypothetical protein
MKNIMPLFCLSLFCIAAAQEEQSLPEQQETQALQSEPTPPATPEVETPSSTEAPPPQPVATIAAEGVIAAEAVAASKPLEFHLGLRGGLGIGQFRGHVSLKTPDGTRIVKLDPSLAFSAGIITQIGINSLFSVAPELQWSLYRASSEIEIKSNNGVYDERAAIMGVYMHALELPILARFNFGIAHAEIGPQIGLNLYSRIYKNANYYRPDMNRLAFGIAAGGGIDLNGILLGARGHFGFLEYAQDAKGIPWNFELSIGKFIF